jgi:SagB-type dehydrogenase family enzyme
MVVWSDDAKRPMPLPRPAGNGGAGGSGAGLYSLSPHGPPPIRREPLAQHVVPYGSILAAHEDCVAPGVAVRDVRPPWTELLPVSADRDITPLPDPERFVGGPSLRHVLETRRNAGDFQLTSIPRDAFWQMNRVAFRGGSYWPIFASGPHVGLIRPVWVVHDVAGMNAGVWSYDPIADGWFQLRYGDYRAEAQALCIDQPAGGSAAAVCFLLADLHSLMKNAGPDLYRMAHLEAGAIAQRLHLAAAGFGAGSAGLGNFYEDDIRTFLGLDNPSWEPLYTVAVGVPL